MFEFVRATANVLYALVPSIYSLLLLSSTIFRSGVRSRVRQDLCRLGVLHSGVRALFVVVMLSMIAIMVKWLSFVLVYTCRTSWKD